MAPIPHERGVLAQSLWADTASPAPPGPALTERIDTEGGRGTTPRPVPFHRCRQIGAGATVAACRLLDRVGI